MGIHDHTSGMKTDWNSPLSSVTFCDSLLFHNLHEKEAHTICYFNLLFSSMEPLATSLNKAKLGG